MLTAAPPHQISAKPALSRVKLALNLLTPSAAFDVSYFQVASLSLYYVSALLTAAGIYWLHMEGVPLRLPAFQLQFIIRTLILTAKFTSRLNIYHLLMDLF